MHGIAISLLKGPATFNEIYRYYEARIHLVPRLRQRLVFVPYNLAHPKWVDDPAFNLKNHIKPFQVPIGTTLDQAIDLALELGEPLLDRSKPLWLTYVMEGVEGRTLLVQLSHHAFVDGATAVAMSTVLTDPAPEANGPDAPVAPWNPPRLPKSDELLAEATLELGRAAIETLTNPQSLVLPVEAQQKALALMARLNRPVMQAPWNSALVGPKRKLTVLQYTLEEFKFIRQQLGGTINDVAIAVVSEGAARYMKAHGELLDNRYIRIMCPVNVRKADVDPLNLEGNQVSAMFPVLPAWPMGMEKRLSEVKKELDEIKARGEPETLEAMQAAQPSVAPTAMAAALQVGTPLDPTRGLATNPSPVLPYFGIRPTQTGFNFTVTNIPGPTWTQYVAGYEVESIYGTLMLGGNLGLGVSLGSVAGKLTFGFTADPRLADAGSFKRHVSDSYVELQELAQKAAGSKG